MRKLFYLMSLAIMMVACRKDKPLIADPNSKYYGIWLTEEIQIEAIYLDGGVYLDTLFQPEELRQFSWDESLLVERLKLVKSILQVKIFGDTTNYEATYRMNGNVLMETDGAQEYELFTVDEVSNNQMKYHFKDYKLTDDDDSLVIYTRIKAMKM